MSPEVYAADVSVGAQKLPGALVIPRGAHSVIAFAHGSGSSRLSPRNSYAARYLEANGFATLLFDLLSPQESADRRNVFDIALLSERVAEAISWLRADARTAGMAIGLFGASTGAAAALAAAAARPDDVRAVVSRGGRPDLAGAALARVAAPSLFIVGGDDRDVLALNREARARMNCTTELVIVPGAGHLFEEPGSLDAALEAASRWFNRYVGGA